LTFSGEKNGHLFVDNTMLMGTDATLIENLMTETFKHQNFLMI